MKKLIAAAMLSIYLFNLGGELALYQYFSSVSDKFFTEQTAKGLYNVGDLTEVKLPVSMPNITDWRYYENIKGSIEFNDVSYNYVKMKLTRTTLYLMCVPNYSTTKFFGQNIINAKHSNDVPVPKKDHVPFGKTTVHGNFNIAFVHFSFSAFEKMLPDNPLHSSCELVSLDREIPRQPPKSFC